MGPAARLDGRDRRILALAVPALAGLAVEPLYVLVDTAIVGHLGRVPLGGLALATTVLNLSFWVFTFLNVGVTTRVAVLMGQGDVAGGGRVAVQGLWLSAVIGPVIAGIIALSARALGRALNGHGAVLDAAVTYLRISAVGLPFVFVSLVGVGFHRGRSDTRTPMRIAIAANAVNIVLEVVLVYGLHTGIAGSAWGTVAAQAFAAVCFARALAPHLRGLTPRPDPAAMRGLAAVGPALFVRTAAIFGAFLLAARAAAGIGDASLGAHQIAVNLFFFLALSTDALAVAAQAMIANLRGAGDRAEMDALSRRLRWWAFAVGGGLAVVVLVLAPVVPYVFAGDGEVRAQAAVAIALLAVMQVAGSIAFVLDGILFAIGDFTFTVWASLAALAAFVPAAVAVRAQPALGLAAVWAGLNVWMLVRAAANWSRLRGGGWIERAIASAATAPAG